MFDLTTPLTEQYDALNNDFAEYYKANVEKFSENTEAIGLMIEKIKKDEVVDIKTYDELSTLILAFTNLFEKPLAEVDQHGYAIDLETRKYVAELLVYINNLPPKVCILTYTRLLHIKNMKELTIMFQAWLDFASKYREFIL